MTTSRSRLIIRPLPRIQIRWHETDKGRTMRGKQIGIIGAGIAGLHLGLYLRQHDIDVTIVTDRTAEQYSKARLLNTAAHFAVTIEREKVLGVDHWANPEFHYFCHNHSFGGSQRLEFRGDFMRPAERSIIASTCQNLCKTLKHVTVKSKLLRSENKTSLGWRSGLICSSSWLGEACWQKCSNEFPFGLLMTARNGSYSPLCSAAYDGQIRLVPRFRFPPAMVN